MADPTSAALRALLDAKGVDRLLAAPPGSIAFDSESERWTRPTTADCWVDGAGNEILSEKLDLWMGEITQVGVPVATLSELLDAAKERDGFAADPAVVARRAALEHLRGGRDAARAAAERAITVAVALEAENSILRPAVDELTRARADAVRASGPDPWADVATLRAGVVEAIETADGFGLAGALEILHRTMRTTDPQRDGS